MNTGIKATILSIVIKTVIMAGIMFLFYYFPDKTELSKSLMKASFVGVFFGVVSTLTQNWWVNRAKRNTDK